MNAPPLARHLLRARDLADSRFADPLDLVALARAARVSPRHFSRSFGSFTTTFRRHVGVSPSEAVKQQRSSS